MVLSTLKLKLGKGKKKIKAEHVAFLWRISYLLHLQQSSKMQFKILNDGNAKQTITIDELLFLIPLVPINSIKPGPASDSKISSNACQISRQEKFARIVRIYSIILH